MNKLFFYIYFFLVNVIRLIRIRLNILLINAFVIVLKC